MSDDRYADDEHVDDSRLKLPSNVEFTKTTLTGEENEDVVFECRAKYMRMRGGEVCLHAVHGVAAGVVMHVTLCHGNLQRALDV